jgi:hypothetical protein
MMSSYFEISINRQLIYVIFNILMAVSITAVFSCVIPYILVHTRIYPRFGVTHLQGRINLVCF